MQFCCMEDSYASWRSILHEKKWRQQRGARAELVDVDLNDVSWGIDNE